MLDHNRREGFLRPCFETSLGQIFKCSTTVVCELSSNVYKTCGIGRKCFKNK